MVRAVFFLVVRSAELHRRRHFDVRLARYADWGSLTDDFKQGVLWQRSLQRVRLSTLLGIDVLYL